MFAGFRLFRLGGEGGSAKPKAPRAPEQTRRAAAIFLKYHIMDGNFPIENSRFGRGGFKKIAPAALVSPLYLA